MYKYKNVFSCITIIIIIIIIRNIIIIIIMLQCCLVDRVYLCTCV